jgi:hypothetical protein
VLCAACRRARPDDELLAFWPVGDPDRRRHVCRPSLGLPGPVGGRGSCFSTVVGLASVHAISLVTPGCPGALPAPVRPDTLAWRQLMDAAGVRAAA